MSGLYQMAGMFVRLINPETAHRMAIAALATGLMPGTRTPGDAALEQTLWGLNFANPVGLAAGFDKNAEAVDGLVGQGFGFVEVGSVTPLPQPGNPRPRLFRLAANGAVINRMGFNNDGLEAVAARLVKRRKGGIVGVNLGKNKSSEDAISDYAQGVAAMAALADYLVVNVSSPNTPGLRALQSADQLEKLLAAVLEVRKEATPDNPPPLLLKIAPDLTDEDKADIARVALETKIDGLIATNTTITRPENLRGANRAETGGLSGRPLFEPSTRVLSEMYQLTEGKLPMIGVGGISSGHDAYAKIRAGASLVQLYTGLIYQGPGLVQRINRDLVALLKADGFSHISEAIGADHR